jgi:hypothetical protein
MVEYTPELAGRAAHAALLREWTTQVERGFLTRDGLFDVRGRIDPAHNEFEPSEQLDYLRIAVMAALGVEIGDLPDSDPAPDSPPADLS